MGITVESWADDLASGALPGSVCTDEERIVGYCLAEKATGEVVVLALLPDHEQFFRDYANAHERSLGDSVDAATPNDEAFAEALREGYGFCKAIGTTSKNSGMSQADSRHVRYIPISGGLCQFDERKPGR